MTLFSPWGRERSLMKMCQEAEQWPPGRRAETRGVCGYCSSVCCVCTVRNAREQSKAKSEHPEQNGIHLINDKNAATFGRKECEMPKNLKGHWQSDELWWTISCCRLTSLKPCSSFFLKWAPLCPDSIYFCNNGVCVGKNISMENLWIVSTGITKWSPDMGIWVPQWWHQTPGVSHSDRTWQSRGSGTGDWHGNITQSNPRSAGKACHCQGIEMTSRILS